MLGTCCGGVGISFMLFAGSILPENDPQMDELRKQFDFGIMELTVMSLLMIVGFMITCLLLAAGYYLIKYKILGRTLSRLYCYSSILTTLISTPVNFMLVTLPMLERTGQTETLPIQIASAVFGLVFSLIYPIVLLVFCSRASFSADLTE